MAQLQAISNAQVVINGQTIAYIPNTVEYTEGQGTQEVMVESAGGGSIQNVYVDDVSTNFSTFKISLNNYTSNIDLIRSWKTNQDSNLIEVTAATSQGTFSRTFQFAALTLDYIVKLGSDTKIDLEFKSAPCF
jgi:hypothetical protein